MTEILRFVAHFAIGVWIYYVLCCYFDRPDRTPLGVMLRAYLAWVIVNVYAYTTNIPDWFTS